jgi:hypothetical protein
VEDNLELEAVAKTDPAFSKGMKADSSDLSDPDPAVVDALFDKPNAVHGLLKVAGSSPQMVGGLLEKIKKALHHDSKVIIDVPGGDKGQIDGATRLGKDRGKEQ